MNELLQKYNLTPGKVVKLIGIALIALFVLAIISSMFGISARSLVSPSSVGESFTMMKGGGYANDSYYAEEAAYDGVSLSERNVVGTPAPIIPGGNPVPGNDAEDFEVTEYNASIESRNKDNECTEIGNLKAKDYVIFENANNYDRGCSFTFKVEKDRAEEILATLEALNPKDLEKNTRTIKRQLDDFTSEQEILEKKLETIEETLESAVRAYDEITDLARRTGDAQSLAEVITSKVEIIERLTRERINIASQLERLSRAKSDQLDKLEYTYFYVNVYENKFIDGEYLKDSWKGAVKNVVYDINRTIQELTVYLVSFLFVLFQYAIYLLILLLVAKFGWKIAVAIWKKQPTERREEQNIS